MTLNCFKTLQQAEDGWFTPSHEKTTLPTLAALSPSQPPEQNTMRVEYPSLPLSIDEVWVCPVVAEDLDDPAIASPTTATVAMNGWHRQPFAVAYAAWFWPIPSAILGVKQIAK